MGIPNHEPSTRSHSEKSQISIINLWLASGLIIAVLGYAVLSGMLIFKMEGFEETQQQAQGADVALEKARTELSSLRLEIDSLKKQKEALAPTIVDWEKRLREKAEAEAAVATWERKWGQRESDMAQADKWLEDTSKSLETMEKQRAALSSEIERLKAECLSWRDRRRGPP
jgi:predicted  nucleic acid-binding Zn-ribbon protein